MIILTEFSRWSSRANLNAPKGLAIRLERVAHTAPLSPALIMDKDTMQKYLRAINENKIASRIKLRVKIYANNSFKKDYRFKAGKFDIELLPIHDKVKFETRNGLSIAFECNAISSDIAAQNLRADLDKELNIFFTVAQITYCLGLRTEEWREIDKEWIGWLTGGGEGFTLGVVHDESVLKFLVVYDTAQNVIKRNDKLSKKALTCIALLRQGLNLESLWPNESYLNFYKVIEIISDALKEEKLANKLPKNQIIDDLISLNIIGDKTQKIKLYFLINALNINLYPKIQIIELAEKRNKAAHTSFHIEIEDLRVCKDLAFDVFSKYLGLI